MRVVRWFLLAAAALALLAAVALVSLTLLINPDRYRGDIQRMVSHATGRPFVIEGHLRMTWFPWLGVRMGAARLGAAPGHPGPDLITWRSARLSLRLLPLVLHRQVVIGPIRLRQPVIHLWLGPHGHGNWQSLLSHPTSGSSATAAPPVLGGLILTDGTLDFQSHDKTLRLTHWRLRLSAWGPGEPLTVSTRFLLQVAPLPAAGVPVALHIRGMQLEMTPLAATVAAMSLKIATATVAGSATVRRDANGLAARGRFALAVPSVRALIVSLGIKTRLPKDPATLGALALSGRARLGNGALTLDPLEGRLDATTLRGWVKHAGGATPRWTFALRADRIDLSSYLPPTRKHPKPFSLPVRALRAVHAQGALTIARATLGTTTLRDIRLQVQ